MMNRSKLATSVRTAGGVEERDDREQLSGGNLKEIRPVAVPPPH